MLSLSAIKYEITMTSATKQHKRDVQYWQQQVTQWKKSGLTQRDYCKQRDFEPYTLSYYQRKFSRMSKKVEKSGFINVPLSFKPPVKSNLTLHFPSGLHLSGIDSNNLGVIKQIVELLS